MPKRKRLRRLCFDVETELFTDQFRYADTAAIRLKHAPKTRVACIYDGARWTYFLPSEAPALIKLLAARMRSSPLTGSASMNWSCDGITG